jgi:hypothetical protein
LFGILGIADAEVLQSGSKLEVLFDSFAITQDDVKMLAMSLSVQGLGRAPLPLADDKS